jgi:hypothetical protein
MQFLYCNFVCKYRWRNKYCLNQNLNLHVLKCTCIWILLAWVPVCAPVRKTTIIYIYTYFSNFNFMYCSFFRFTKWYASFCMYMFVIAIHLVQNWSKAMCLHVTWKHQYLEKVKHSVWLSRYIRDSERVQHPPCPSTVLSGTEERNIL